MRRCRRRGGCAPKLLEEAPADQNIRLFQRLQPQISSSHFVRRRDLLARFENYIPAALVLPEKDGRITINDAYNYQ